MNTKPTARSLRLACLGFVTFTSLVGASVLPSHHGVPLASAQTCGPTQSGGSWTFPWLHVTADGIIVDPNGCHVPLLGFNLANVENGYGDGDATPQLFTWFKSTFTMNLWRVGLNNYWYSHNLPVPNQNNMGYRQWVRQLVGWIEQSGAYVLLQTDAQFHAPPCGGSVSFCAPQNYGTLISPPDPSQCATGANINDALTMWSDLAKTYSNDPGVLYDVWGEMKNQCGVTLTDQQWRNNQAQMIDTIRAQNSRSLVFVTARTFGNNYNPIVKGSVPDWTEANLVWDIHAYPGPNWPNTGNYVVTVAHYPAHANEQIGFAHSHGQAVCYCEWGGDSVPSSYNSELFPYNANNHVGMAYFHSSNVMNQSGQSFQLNSLGQLVKNDYASYNG